MNDEKEQGLFGALVGWVKHPFNSNGSVLNWVLIVGVILVAVWFWNWILIQLIED